MNTTNDARRGAVAGPVDQLVRPRADIARVMSAVWDLVRRGPNFDGRQSDVEIVVAAEIDRAVAAERERIAAFHFNQLEHDALSAITLDTDWSDTRARLAYARKVADATARSFAWQLKQVLRA